MRVVFMGTPDFAVPTLKKLIETCNVVGVVTQPDRRAGRGRRLRASPVKEVALAHGLEVWQPASLRRDPEAVSHLRGWRPDAIVVAAFGQILPAEVLAIPPHGCLNVHASLLPRHRGAAPIAAAILSGDEHTGVTIMLMDEGMDTGPILAQAKIPISPKDTTLSLSERLAPLGADLLAATLPRWVDGKVEPTAQDESRATYCHPVAKTDGLIDWSLPAVELERRARAYYPWPGLYTTWQGRKLSVWPARAVPEWSGEGEPGQVIELASRLAVVTGQGALILEEVQLAGKRAMPAREFARGQRGFVGAKLGTDRSP